MAGDFTVYAEGACFASVCTILEEVEEIEKRMNEHSPTGIDSKWKVSEDNFFGGKPNPCQCNLTPDYKHYLLVC
jgi:hypothetical protein